VELPALPITSFSLETGLSVSIVHLPAAETTAIRLWVPRAGGHPFGPVAAAVSALRAGTKHKGDVLINPKLSGVGIGIRTEPHGSTLSWTALARASKTAVGLLGSFASQPVFEPRESLDRVRLTIKSVERYSQSPTYGDDIGRAALPTIELKQPDELAKTLVSLSPERLLSIYQCTFSPEGAELVIVGPRKAAEVERWVREAFSGWTRADAGSDCENWGYHPVKAAKPLERPRLYVVHRGFEQPDVLAIVPAPPLGHEDHYPFWLSAVAMSYRQQDAASQLRHSGATYGIHPRLNNTYPDQSLFELSGALRGDRATEGVRDLLEDLKTFSTSVSDEEIDRAKRSSLTNYLASASNEGGIADVVAHARRQRVGARDVSDLERQIQSLTPDQCRAAAARWTKDVHPVVMAGGQRTAAFKRLKLGAQIVDYWFESMH
jgi:predicted Zn-dependent peptidase